MRGTHFGVGVTIMIAALVQDEILVKEHREEALDQLVRVGKLAQLHQHRANMVAEAKALVRQRFPNLDLRATCLYHAAAIIQVAKQHGVHLVLQAGTTLWPRMEPWQDDGVSPTHFGYQWEDTTFTRRRIAAGLLPEIHVWAGDPKTQEIVDITTGFFPAQCRALIGADWPGEKPPEWVWAHGSELPRGVIYQPTREATLTAARMMQHMVDESR